MHEVVSSVTRLLTVSATASVVALGGCGDSPDVDVRTIKVPAPPGGEAEQEIAGVLRSAQAAFAVGDMPEVCRHLTRRASHEAGTVAHSVPTTCEANVGKWFGPIRGGGFYDDANVTAVRIDGGRATATIAEDVRHPYDLELAWEGGEWKIDSFFRISRDSARAWAAIRPVATFPPAERAAVEATDGNGDPCPAVDVTGIARISGGCLLEVASPGTVPIMISTPLGEFNISNCAGSQHVYVDAQGRTWSDGFQLIRGPADDINACGDMHSCLGGREPGTLGDDTSLPSLPQPGRIRSDGQGGYLLVTDACFETCVGYYVGELVMELTPDGQGWRGLVDDTGLGRTGIRFDMPLEIGTPDGFELSPVERRNERT